MTQPNTPAKDYLTTRETAKLLNVAVSTVQLWTDNGLLKAWTTAGGHRRISRESVEQILQQQKGALSNEEIPHRFTIVVVEDNPQDQLLYQQHFDMWQLPAEVIIAHDGYEGLLTIGKTCPDLVISDLVMPNMDGFELIRAIKTNPDLCHTMVMVVSGLSEDEISFRGGLTEDVLILRKPIDFNELLILIRKNIELSYKTIKEG